MADQPINQDKDARMSTKQVAELAGVSPDTVLNWVRAGLLTPLGPAPPAHLVKRRGRLYFDRAAVEALLAPRNTPPAE
jgi:DNA-binding transcriptional MerR regulator